MLWKQHGGSGLSMTLDELLDLEFSRFNWLYTRFCEQREREYKQLGGK